MEERDGDGAAIGASSGGGTEAEVSVPDAVEEDTLSEDGIQETPGSSSSSREGTSGYSAGSGSSTASINSASGADESADRSQESVQPVRRTWVPGKRHPEEVSLAYACRAMHVLRQRDDSA